jgi:peptide/nickel transport system substrate-binding protein
MYKQGGKGMRRSWKTVALALVLVFVLGTMFGCQAKPSESPSESPSAAQSVTPSESAEVVTPGGELPRNETLYIGGLQWGRIVGWNPYSGDMNNAIAVTEEPARQPVWETLYMYNLLDGQMYPLLAGEAYEWNADQTAMTVKLNPDAKWSDGTPVTAEDVAYTYATHLKYQTNRGVEFQGYIESVEATDTLTVVIHSKLNDAGVPVNPLKVVEYLGKCYVVQKAYTQIVEERNNYETDAFKNDPCTDFVASGPYKSFYEDDQKVVYIRDDNYWGQAASMWGKLPVPKYICHTIYADNAATQVAFEAGEIDVDQQFIPDIQKLWLEKGLPISTYIDEAPYGICTAIPTAWYNMKSYGLDNVAVRKAIAIAVDYDAINANAMTKQSPTFQDVPRSIKIGRASCRERV